jgi:hypothetical protein
MHYGNNEKFYLKPHNLGRAWWYTPVIPVTGEVKVGGTGSEASQRKNVSL